MLLWTYVEVVELLCCCADGCGEEEDITSIVMV